MRHLLLFVIIKTCNIRVKWKGWPKNHIGQVIIQQLWMQCILAMLYLGEQLFTEVCSAKHAHYLLGVGDKVGDMSSWKHMVLREIEDMTSKKLKLQIFWCWLVVSVLWHINLCRLLNAKSIFKQIISSI